MIEILNELLLVWDNYNNKLDICVEEYVKYLELIVKIRNKCYELTREDKETLKEFVKTMMLTIDKLKKVSVENRENINSDKYYNICDKFNDYFDMSEMYI